MLSTILLTTLALLPVTCNAGCFDNPDPCAREDQSIDPAAYFTELNNYSCLDINSTAAICTCPDGFYTVNVPCRICNRNPCGTGPNFVACTEEARTFKCVCRDASGGLSRPCNTGPIDPGPSPSSCQNGGVFDAATTTCNCPSGFDGTQCQTSNPRALCDNIVCMYQGVCAVRNPTGPYQAVCLCQLGKNGDYCENIGTLGSCYTGLCQNGALCTERTIGSSKHAYCQCPPGYRGSRCEDRYFNCVSAGNQMDTYMHNQGKYFSCSLVGGVWQLRQQSCPKGLKFNTIKQLCLR